jgi:hypothetical protein
MTSIVSDTARQRLDAMHAAFPAEGLFADKEWLLSPEPFLVEPKLAEQLAKLGHRLNLFNKACNELYQRSISGKQPGWIADYLDRGKPPELVEFSRRKIFRADLPRVIRPDLVLTESGPDGRLGFTIAELDTIPGGIGLTQWLNATYASFGTHDLIGGASGMLDGFRSILGGTGEVLVSNEAATYRPEMRYLARLSEGALRVHEAESYRPSPAQPSLYRFFEHFDLPNLPSASAIQQVVADGAATITPPFKPYLEEKLWFALFWLRPLREFWRRELSERHFLELQKVIPYTWILDPQALPHHAVIPFLEIQSFEELKTFSQKQRELILKISGFHETAWGSRSVVLGSDASQTEWTTAITDALGEFPTHPHILQRFHKGRLVDQRFLNPATGDIGTLHGRVRLCPYYFVIDGQAELRGALATVCPADKKLLHGMKDAIMVPTAIAAA